MIRWIGLPILITVFSIIPYFSDGAITDSWFVLIVWIVVLLHLSTFKSRLRKLKHWLQRYPIVLWCVILLFIAVVFGYGFAVYQPVLGRTIDASMITFGLFAFWGFWQLIHIVLSRNDNPHNLPSLENSPWTGGLITLTTLIMMCILIESGMRLFMVQSDAFAFTIMHQQWEALYWNPINELGYRDYPVDTDEDKIHIVVLGDSFASGHGVNSIDDTFPHILASLLNENSEDYTVNIIAELGWGTQRQSVELSEFPVQPDIVILSYFINDIDEVLLENPVQVNFPEPPISWLTENYFLPSFLYWHIFQLGIGGESVAYKDRLFDAYEDDILWEEHSRSIRQILRWSGDRQIPVIALIWGDLRRPDNSEIAVKRVADFFVENNTPLVIMPDHLAHQSPEAWVVNPFDAHPNEQAHRIAAQQLLPLVQQANLP